MADSSRYSRLARDRDSPCSSPGALSSSSSDTLLHDGNESEDSIPLTRSGAPPLLARRAAKNTKPVSAAPQTRYLFTSRRFWADFTMGFADGLTVPFALTAGLSSLGQTETVVFAGLAEVSAGCISMGIGGYLSARQSSPSTAYTGDDDDDDDASSCEAVEVFRWSREDQEKRTAAASPTTSSQPSVLASRYLAPLSLPADLQHLVVAHIAAQPDTIQAILAAESQKLSDPVYGLSETGAGADADDDDDVDGVWPVASGLSVAFGYLIGGLLPLGPYFFVEHVGNGLRWSFAVCIVALFLFGFLRDFALDSQAATDSGSARKMSSRQLSWHKSPIPWHRLWKSTLEGLQMVILGGIAAFAAVLCVRMFESQTST